MEELEFDPTPAGYKKLFDDLVNKALTNSHTQFQFIGSWDEYKALKAYTKGTKKIIKYFEELLAQAVNFYAREIKIGHFGLQNPVQVFKLRVCRDFYIKELSILKDMKSEYWAYVWGGHVWDTLVGNHRLEEDEIDFRKLPWKLW